MGKVTITMEDYGYLLKFWKKLEKNVKIQLEPEEAIDVRAVKRELEKKLLVPGASRGARIYMDDYIESNAEGFVEHQKKLRAYNVRKEAEEARRKEKEESEKEKLVTNLRNKAGNISMESGHPVIDNTWSAFYHYFTGNGESAYIGEDTVDILLKHFDFTYKHKRIINGKTTSLSGNFSVDLRDEVFHIGYTNVDYVIECTSEICKVTYSIFVRDGFWDVDFIDEVVMGKWLDEKNFKPDGLGPNLERLGGTPYKYIPYLKTYIFDNPGY